jgi:TatD DNase family protein
VAKLVDTHCHLFMAPIADDLEPVLDRARSAGVTRLVVPSFDRASWGDVEALSVHDGVFVAYGLHPWVAEQDLDLERLERLLQSEGAVAVGEIGLDYAVPSVERERQLEVFTHQLELARALDLPVILHCRKAYDDLIAVLQERSSGLAGVVHGFSRGPELGRRLVDLGLHLAFGGTVTRSGAHRARRSAAEMPLERILLETDAPSVGVAGVEPEAVEPRHVVQVAATVSEVRGEPFDRLARETTHNALSLFRL